MGEVGSGDESILQGMADDPEEVHSLPEVLAMDCLVCHYTSEQEKV